jgi:hypothetical protein
MQCFLSFLSGTNQHIAVLDRDIQCNFDTEFWEESQCSWRYSQSTATALSLGSVSRFQWVAAGSSSGGNSAASSSSGSGKYGLQEIHCCTMNNSLAYNTLIAMLNE